MSKVIERANALGIEYRKMTMEARASDDDKYVVTGYATTFNQPYELYRYGKYSLSEQVDPNAFAECQMDDVIMQYDHEGRVFARTRNNTLSLDTDDNGLFITANLGGTEAGRQLYEEIKGGYTDRMSFGFIVAEDTRSVTESDERYDELRTITKISRLFDVSAVSIPANDATSISARSKGESFYNEMQKTIEERATIERKKKILRFLLEV